jgi:hypothetical protein
MVCGHRSFRNSENIAPTHTHTHTQHIISVHNATQALLYIHFFFLTSTSIRRSAQIQYLSLPAAAKNDGKQEKKIRDTEKPYPVGSRANLFLQQFAD